ncbi:MAG: Nif3-like dinuclear metal center hexameric protein [Verrucomicrobia bacterium]|nr:Nif3-like dinuclear metal center hexameric protein [Verrucomicrobiota bacterium]
MEGEIIRWGGSRSEQGRSRFDLALQMESANRAMVSLALTKFPFGGVWGIHPGMTPRELARICDRILKTKKFRDYPGARNGLQVFHGRPVKKIGWAVDADLESIRRAGRGKVDFLVVHHGIFWGQSTLDRKIRARRIREAKRLGVAVYSSHLPLDAHPEVGNSIGLLRFLGLGSARRKAFGLAMGRTIGWKVEGGKWKRARLVQRCRNLPGAKVKVLTAGPAVCRKIGIVTGGFGDLDQVVKAGLDTLITGEADYPTEVKARELGINLILAGHGETEVFGAKGLKVKISKTWN